MSRSTTAAPVAPDSHLLAVTLLDVRAVARLLDVHQRSVWRLAALSEADQGDFPKPIRIGPKTVRWRLRDIETYVARLAGEEPPDGG
jgi:predicted DNA-binding transcriptional regulator AlpA